MNKLYLNYDPFYKNVIYENNNLLINGNISYSNYVENQNIVINIINIFLLILFFHYNNFLKIIKEIFTL